MSQRPPGPPPYNPRVPKTHAAIEVFTVGLPTAVFPAKPTRMCT